MVIESSTGLMRELLGLYRRADDVGLLTNETALALAQEIVQLRGVIKSVYPIVDEITARRGQRAAFS